MFKKPLLIIGLFVILAAIPLTVFLSQQQQEIRQRASEFWKPPPESPGGDVIPTTDCDPEIAATVCKEETFVDTTGRICAGAKYCPPPPIPTKPPGGSTPGQPPEESPGGVCTSGAYKRQCTGQQAGCASDAGEQQVWQCNSDGSGWGASWGECSTDCSSTVGGSPPPPTYQPPPAGGSPGGIGGSPTPPTASLTGPNSGTVGQNLTYNAQFSNGGSATVFVSRQDNNTFTCPPGISTDSTGRKWCTIGTLTGNSSTVFTPRETGTYAVVVNAYANSTATFTADRATECTGNPFGLNPTQQAQWSDCGSNDNIQLTISSILTPTLLVADVDKNGCIGIVDFNLWLRAYQTGIIQSGTYPDINNDGRVDLLDFNAWYRAIKSLPDDKRCR